MEYLNRECTGQLWNTVKTALGNKQEKLRGTKDELVGFAEDGNPVARATAVPGGIATLDASGVLTRAQRPSLAEIKGGSKSNLLDNWYFIDPINQRGKTEYLTKGYTIDRWSLPEEGMSVKLLSSGIQFGNNDSMLVQRLESHTLEPGIYTLSILSTSGVHMLSCYIENSGYIFRLYPQDEQLSTHTFEISDLDSRQNIWFSFAVEDNSIAIAAKLEQGNQQTLACQDTDGTWRLNDSPPIKALELLKCQRYFERIGIDFSDIVADSIYCPANAKYLYFTIRYSKKRLERPSIIITNAGQFRILLRGFGENINLGAIGLTELKLVSISSTLAVLCGVAYNTSSVGSYGILQRQDGATSAWIDVSSDL